MVVIVQILTALILAAVLTTITTVVFKRHRHGVEAVVFFLVIFLAAWGGGLWMNPVGPSLHGVAWLPFLLVALIVSLVLITFVPRRPPKSVAEAKEQIEFRQTLEDVFSLSLIVLLAALVVAVVLGYLIV
ncbi:MAG: hypothetical protein ACQETQ_09205 [Spirochaetota bacterium]